jgi:hypothetical protein
LALLKQYEEELYLVHALHVGSENQLYYAIKGKVEKYDDGYYHCSPSLERVAGVDLSYSRKAEVEREMGERGKAIRLLRGLQLQEDQPIISEHQHREAANLCGSPRMNRNEWWGVDEDGCWSQKREVTSKVGLKELEEGNLETANSQRPNTTL